MSFWAIEPRDPLVVRDGRPNTGHGESAPLPFPYPSTVAGMIRTRFGTGNDGAFDRSLDLARLRDVAIRGPLLVHLPSSRIFAPHPRDCVILAGLDDRKSIRALQPLDVLPRGTLVDDALGGSALIGFPDAGAHPGKPSHPPTFWPWDAFERWLCSTEAKSNADDFLAGALEALPIERRVHVTIGAQYTAEDGMLFEIGGLRFHGGPWSREDREAPSEHRPESSMALGIDVDASGFPDKQRTLTAGIGPSGGERRLAYWSEASQIRLPQAPPKPVLDFLGKQGSCARVRVILLTPGIFDAGWKPGSKDGQLLAARHGITAELVGACVPRSETISGWDFEHQRPKKTRRIVSSGSVYWLDLHGAPEARVKWATEIMMSNVSDAAQDRNDGFGLAAVGVGS
jgi:CRISPR-associated protein Cmr3